MGRENFEESLDGYELKKINSLLMDRLKIVRDLQKEVCYLNRELLDSEEVMLELCEFIDPKSESSVSQYASELFAVCSRKIKNTESVVKIAISADGFLLQHVSEELKDKEEIVKSAFKSLKRFGNLLRYASDRLKDNAAFIQWVIKEAGNQWEERVLQFAGEGLMDDEGFVRSMIETSSRAEGIVNYASKRLKDDDEFVHWVITREGGETALEHVSKRLQAKYQQQVQDETELQSLHDGAQQEHGSNISANSNSGNISGSSK